MSFPMYPEYKHSGVEWLGEVPKHWDVKALRYLTVCLDGKRIPLNGEQRADKRGDVPYWGANAIMDYVDEAIFDEELLLVGEDGAPFLDPLKPVAFHSSGPVWPNNHIHVLRPNKPEWVKFLVYAMNAADYANFIEGSTRQKLNQSRLMAMPVSWPHSSEKIQITNFLDHETAKIDALIAEQQRLIELLKEKRQAVISHAVTKGLNPNAPMKDSGVKWLGDVPAHWDVVPFGFAIEFQEGPGIMATDFYEEGIPLLRVSGVQGRWASLLGCNYLDPEKVAVRWNHFRLNKGDLLISASASMGSVCEVGEEAEGAVAYTGLIRLKPRFGISSRDYVRAVVGSYQFHVQIDLFKAGSTIQHYGPTHLSQMKVVLPPLNEQEKIADYVQGKTDEFESLLSQAYAANGLLQERRSALISAAVTGKIDVRNWQPAEVKAETDVQERDTEVSF